MLKSISTLLGLFFLFCTSDSKAQDIFKWGAYWDQNGKEISCLIKYLDWRDSPKQIEIKSDSNSASQILSIKDIKSFEIPKLCRYELHTVQINRTSDKVDQLEKNGLVKWQEEELVLRVIIKGEATLYAFEESNLKRFFYRVGEDPIKTLMYKKYLGPNKKIGYNRGYQSQLREKLSCGEQNWEIEYKEKPLLRYFSDYNECRGEDSETFQARKDYYLKLGLALSLFNYDFRIQNAAAKLNFYTFEKRQDLSFGLSVAYVLPSFNNKWEILFETHYRQYQNTGEYSREERGRIAILDYNGWEILGGVRRVFPINNDWNLLMDAAYVVSFQNNSIIPLTEDRTLNIAYSKRNSLARFGLGVTYKRHNLSFQYYLTKDLGNFNFFYDANLSRFGFQYRIDLFKLQNPF